MVFEERGEHDRIVGDGQGSGELVDCLGRVLDEDDDITFGIGPEEIPDEFPGAFERVRAQTRLVARASVDSRVEREELVDCFDDRSKRRRTGCIVEVDERRHAAVEQRDELIDPDERIPRNRRG